MKMSDVFALPIRYGSPYMRQLNDASIDQLKSAARAINNHDALVEALDDLLELCDRWHTDEEPGDPPNEIVKARAALTAARQS